MRSMPTPAAAVPRTPTLPADFRPAESSWLGTSYGVTMPAPFEATAPSEAFVEPLRGLAVREVREPEVFRLFFGRKAKRD
jgi:hypothetical protein